MFDKIMPQKKRNSISCSFSTTNEQIEKSSSVTLFAEEMGDLNEDEKKLVRSLFEIF